MYDTIDVTVLWMQTNEADTTVYITERAAEGPKCASGPAKAWTMDRSGLDLLILNMQ